MNVIAKLSVGIMRAIYALIKLFPQKKKITILSRQSNAKSEDIVALEEYIRRTHPDIKLEILVKMVKGPTYAIHMLKQMYAIASSKLVVVDGYCITACVLNHKPGTKIVQIWHASAAIKKFGHQCLDMPSGHSAEMAEIMCMHRNYDYVVSPSIATGRLFCRGFNTPENRIRVFGLPRLEKLVCEEPDSIPGAKAIVDDGRKIVVYVPTLRKTRPVNVLPLARAIDDSRYKLVVRLHPLDRIEEINDAVIDFGEEYSTFEWLKKCDYIITDYSALGIEAALLEKPIFFYVYDIDRYLIETGLNINPLDEMRWCSSKNACEIAEMIDSEYDLEMLRHFREKYIEVEPHNCTKRLAEFLVETVNEQDQEAPQKLSEKA